MVYIFLSDSLTTLNDNQLYSAQFLFLIKFFWQETLLVSSSFTEYKAFLLSSENSCMNGRFGWWFLHCFVATKELTNCSKKSKFIFFNEKPFMPFT